MEYFGALLKNTREKKGLSLDAAHKATKIPKDILSDIEEDKISTLNPVYLKGYLKIYSRYLELDAAQVSCAYKAVLPKEEKVPSADMIYQRKEKKPFPLVRFDFTIVLNIIVALSLAFTAVVFLRYVIKKKKAAPAKVAPLTKKQNQKISSPVNKVVKPAEVLRAQKEVASTPSDSVRLAIQAKENTYLQVTVDGSTMFKQVLRKGQTESWQARDKIELSIANAAAVQLELNGKILPPLGRKNQPIKNMVINRDGSFHSK